MPEVNSEWHPSQARGLLFSCNPLANMDLNSDEERQTCSRQTSGGGTYPIDSRTWVDRGRPLIRSGGQDEAWSWWVALSLLGGYSLLSTWWLAAQVIFGLCRFGDSVLVRHSPAATSRGKAALATSASSNCLLDTSAPIMQVKLITPSFLND
jgi:hypothetical protein